MKAMFKKIIPSLFILVSIGCSTDLTYYTAYSEPKAGYSLVCSLPHEIFLPMRRYPLTISIDPKVSGKFHMKIRHYHIEGPINDENKMRILKEEEFKMDLSAGNPQEQIFSFTAVKGSQSIYIESELKVDGGETYSQTAIVNIIPE